MSEVDKTVVNWSGGSTLQTWKDGEWQILYAKDATGREITLSLADHEAYRFAWSLSPAANYYFERMRAANNAVYELSYPEARADNLRQVAEEIDCGGGCDKHCNSHTFDRGDFCSFAAAEDLRKLAAALDLKASLGTRPVAQAPSKEELFCHWLKGYLHAVNGRDELFASEANVIRNNLNEMLGGAYPLPSTKPLCPNGLEHGNCGFPDCVPSCPGRLSLSSPEAK